MLNVSSSFFLNILRIPINRIMKYLNFYLIYKSGKAIGDQLLLTGVTKLIKKKYNFKIILFVNYSSFFINNPNVFKVIRLNNSNFFDRIIFFILKNLSGECIKEFLPQKKNRNGKHFLINYNKNLHIAETHCQHFNLKLNFKNFKNEIFFSELELKKYNEELKLPENFSIIQSISKQTFTKNKEWKIEGMQNIVNFFNNINWVQVGRSNEPILENCKHMLDLDFRKLSYVFKKAEFVVCYEGFFNHLASCFEKKNFLIHTGFLPTSFSFYPNNILIENNSKISCYPCYDLKCKNHNRSVNEQLKEEFVIKRIINNIS